MITADGPKLRGSTLLDLADDRKPPDNELPALRRWMRRIRGIPGFLTMPGIPAYH